jgi:hypothetical protein
VQPTAGAGQTIVTAGPATALPICDANGNQVQGVAVTGRTVTVGGPRTLATFSCTTVSLVAGQEQDITLSGTDTKIYQNETLLVSSTHVGTGVADPGGLMQLETTAFGEGTD